MWDLHIIGLHIVGECGLQRERMARVCSKDPTTLDSLLRIIEFGNNVMKIILQGF